MVYAVTEGEEEPLKYPVMFRAADVVVVNKIDLLPRLEFDLEAFLTNLTSAHPTAQVIMASARTGKGLDEWCDWQVDRHRELTPNGPLSSGGSEVEASA